MSKPENQKSQIFYSTEAPCRRGNITVIAINQEMRDAVAQGFFIC